MKDTVASLIRNMIKENNHNTNISFPAVVVGTERLEDGLLDVKPVVRYSNSFTGETTDYPILREIPVVTPSTKNSSITFPIIQGDYVELLVQSVDIQKFVNGNGETHDPDIPAYGNLSNVIALVGFTPYQESPFNPNNYSNDFNNQDLNIVHNKNTGLESSVNISASGSILQKAPNAVTIDSPLFDVKSDLLNANNAVITTGGDVVVQGQSLNQFMLDAPLNLKGGDGNRGWSPVLAVENRGQEEAVLKLTDWVGGEGDKPSEQGYIGSNGLVSNILDAINIRGARGKSGAALSADTIQEVVNNQLTTDRVMDLIQGQIDESALTDILTSKIADIEVVKMDVAREARDRVKAIEDTAKLIEAEAKQRVEDVRLLAEGQANIEGDALAIVEAINTERQERIDALADVGDEISLEQQARIDSITKLGEGFHEEIVKTKDAVSAVDSRITTLVLETEDNLAAVRDEITLKTDENSALSQKISTVLAKTAENEAAVTKETRARTDALEAVAEDITTLTTKTGENEAAVKEESRVRTNEDSALSERIVTLTAETGENKAAIQKESEARTTDIESVTKDITTLVSKTDENEAAITKESETRTTAFESLSKDIEVVSSKTDGNTASITALDETFTTELSAQAQTLKFLSSEVSLGYADKTKYADKSRATAWTFAKTLAHADYTNAQMTRGLTADFKDSSARFSENIELLSRQNEAVATKTGVLSAQVLGNDYEGGGLGKLNSGLIFEESKARASDVEGLAEQISLLSAGVGEQFDSFEIWHFNKDKDGWTGGTFSGGWIDVKTETLKSPQIEDLDGAVYKHVKLRIKKFGQPTWSGLLIHVGGSKTIKEPSYDEDGVALANWQLDWVGDISSFTLKLASVADAENYYSIDWIAVGRPSPGASNAALLRESKVRASETSANASDLVKLDSQINGGTGVPIESSITKKLETTANVAKTTAEKVDVLTSTYNTDMYEYEGVVQTTARTLAEATQAEAERLDLLSADIKPRYADASRYVNINRATQWTYWKTIAADNYNSNQRVSELKSEFLDSNANLTSELFTLAQADKAISSSISQLSAKTGENYGLIQDLQYTITTPSTGLAAKVTELQASTSTNSKDIETVGKAAKAAAELAGNKGEVIYSSTEPTKEEERKVQNLWIDTSGGKNTPKRWAGSSWLAVTDKAATDAQAAADKANKQLLPANIATLVEGSGAFAGEFGAISGKFATMQGVVDGQKTAIETVSAVGNVEKLKNEVAKARLDKDLTHLNAQVTALDNAIIAYDKRVVELTAKRDAPKPPDMTQEAYTALRASYQSQIEEVRKAKTDAVAQKDVIADNAKQLADEKAVLDSLVITEKDVKAQHTIKVDAGGKIAGYGLVVQKDNYSAFDIRADRFTISPPANGIDNGKSPFMVLTTPKVIDGVRVEAGTYMRQTYIAKASIDLAQINTASITSLSALSATIGHFKSAESGARLEIKDSLLSVYDDNDRLRVRLGIW